ncbi:phosphomannomutase, partial [Thermoproteota archaeon]
MTISETDFDHIFRAYDIRGIFGKDLTQEVATKIGAAFTKFLDGKTVVVGRDVRLSGEKLRDALVSGLVTRSNVTDVGVLPT